MHERLAPSMPSLSIYSAHPGAQASTTARSWAGSRLRRGTLPSFSTCLRSSVEDRWDSLVSNDPTQLASASASRANSDTCVMQQDSTSSRASAVASWELSLTSCMSQACMRASTWPSSVTPSAECPFPLCASIMSARLKFKYWPDRMVECTWYT